MNDLKNDPTHSLKGNKYEKIFEWNEKQISLQNFFLSGVLSRMIIAPIH